MPRRKNSESEAVPKMERTPTASRAKAPAAKHKSAAKPRATKTVAETVLPVPAPPASPLTPATDITQEAIARLAYSYWKARGCQGGSPEADWLRAESELRNL